MNLKTRSKIYYLLTFSIRVTYELLLLLKIGFLEKKVAPYWRDVWWERPDVGILSLVSMLTLLVEQSSITFYMQYYIANFNNRKEQLRWNQANHKKILPSSLTELPSTTRSLLANLTKVRSHLQIEPIPAPITTPECRAHAKIKRNRSKAITPISNIFRIAKAKNRDPTQFPVISKVDYPAINKTVKKN